MAHDAQVQRFLRRSMTMRVATLSTNGVPHITPLRFIYDGRTIYALPGAASPTARHIREQPGVVLLIDAEQTTGPVLRVRAHAAIRSEPHRTGWYERRAATKYFLQPGGIWNMLTHWRNLPTWVTIRRNATPGDAALIEFVPETAEFVSRPTDEDAPKHEGEAAVGVDDSGASRRRSPLKFFLLVFALSIPFWILGAVTGAKLSSDLPVSSFVWICPVIAASILVWRENKRTGVIALLKRSFDYKRVPNKIWYGPMVILPPCVYALTYGVMRLMGLSLPSVQFPVLAAVGMFLGYFIAGQFEELGWTGYAIEPLQNRANALQASILLGLVWATFHYVPLVQLGRSPGWIAWWSLNTVALRVLFTWLFNNAGKSVFAAALFHAVANISHIGPFLDFGAGGYSHDAQRISALIMVATAALITVAWGPRTLAGHRKPSAVSAHQIVL